MEESAGGVKKFKPTLFRKAGKVWLKGNAHWSESTREINTLKLNHLLPTFGKLLRIEISCNRNDQFQLQRQRDGAANREINMEVGVLRMFLHKHRLWYLIEPDYRPLPEPEDIGRPLDAEEVTKLLTEAINSRRRSLLPALMICLHTGVRGAESRKIKWRQVDFNHRVITVGKPKTRGGEGREMR